jgi:membrane fusion protein, multidrug efflux system
VDALLVPQRAVLQSPTGASVYVIGEDGKAEQRGVALSEWTDEDWVVESGLSAGERVITDHLLQVRPGTPVVPAAAAEPGAEGR